MFWHQLSRTIKPIYQYRVQPAMKVLIAFNNNPIMATENYLINIQIM